MQIIKATKNHIPSIVALLADDKLGKLREDFQSPLPESYYAAFEQINSDQNQNLMVVINPLKEVIGTFQLTFIPYLTYRGRMRAQIEAVRIRKDMRGKGMGKNMMEWAIREAKEKNAHVVQLTTDKKRPESIQFYQSLGFVPSHEGMKLHLDLK